MTRRKLFSGLLALAVLLGPVLCAGAEETPADETPARRAMSLSGQVVATETKAVLAPFGGTMGNIGLKPGDIVGAGDVLFTLDTQKVYAPCDGTVGSIGAQTGDDTAYLQERYGAVMFIVPDSQYLIDTDTGGAYNASENKTVRMGETVYIGSRLSSSRNGVGFIAQVNGEKYTVEVTGGNLTMEDAVTIYREPGFAAASKIGTGDTKAVPNVIIKASGSVFKNHVEQGQHVARGDLLMEVVGGTLVHTAFPAREVTSGYAAIVASVDAAPGMQVSQDQALATLYPLDSLRASVDVYEADLGDILVGDRVRVELAPYFDQQPLDGVVTAISGLSGAQPGEEPRYSVTCAFDVPDYARVGLSANVYFLD